jgi:Uri superfamily endonuclease
MLREAALEPIAALQSRPGTYALILSSAATATVVIGRLGQFPLIPGGYIYVGSAHGPGGLRARVGHHARPAVRPHWHIDYFRPFARLDAVWYSYDPEKREHQWAEILAGRLRGHAPLVGFGASDCACPAHLFYFASSPAIRPFLSAIHQDCRGHDRIYSRRFKLFTASQASASSGLT